MSVAQLTANLSKCQRMKVGSVIVKDNRIISCGYNGLPVGWEPDQPEITLTISKNEYDRLSDLEKRRFGFIDYNVYVGLKTLDEVIHSEMNALSRLAASTESGIGAKLFCTHSPCIQCAKGIFGSGIDTVYYNDMYRSNDGLVFLEKCGVKIIKYE